MAELALNYSEIEEAGKAAEETARGCENYIDQMERCVTTKIGSVRLGESAYTSQANFYAKQKISELEQKRDRYRTYANTLDQFVNDPSGAREVDKSVANAVNQSYTAYIESHNIKVNPVVAGLTAISVWLDNEGTWVIRATGIGSMLAASYEFAEFFRGIGEDLQYWYRCEGGKHIVKGVALAVLAVGAVVTAVLAFPAVAAAWGALVAALTAGAGLTALLGAAFSFLTATAALVSGVMGAASTIFDMAYEFRAGMGNGQDVERMMDSRIDGVSDWMRNKMTSWESWDKVSTSVAEAWDTTELVCGLISFVDMAKNGVTSLGEGSLRAKLGSAKEKLLTWKENGLRTLKTDVWGKAKEGLHQFRTGGQTGGWSEIKDAGKNFSRWVDHTVDSVNNATENKTLKGYGEQWVDNLPEGGLKSLFKNLDDLNDSGKWKLLQGTAKYANSFLDEGFVGVAKETVKEFDIVDTALDVAEDVKDLWERKAE